jgi:hypothetical protein
MLEKALISAVHWYKDNKYLLAVRRWVNQLYYDPSIIHIKPVNFDYIVVDGCKYLLNDQVNEVERITNNQFLVNIKPTDTVLDIGAHIGGEAIPLAMLASRGEVYAVEPVFSSILLKNVSLNNLRNVQIIPYGLGVDNHSVEHNYGTYKMLTGRKTFKDYKKMCGKIDFLWCNCEGGEWAIQPEDLEGIREIRFMLHIRAASRTSDKACEDRMYQWLHKERYELSIRNFDWKPNVLFKECYWLKASK